jgi:hypothetical protein
MPFNPYTPRVARVTISVSRPDANGNAAQQTYNFQQHRMRIQVRQGGKQFGNAKVEIYGVPLATMNQIARLWLEALTPQGTDTIQIDVLQGDTFVPFFQGIITWSAVNPSRSPQVFLDIEANAGMALTLAPASPYSTPGGVTLKSALETIVQPAGFQLDYAADAPVYQLGPVRVTGAPLDQVGQLMSHYPDLTWTPNLQRLQVRKALAPLTSTQVDISADNGLQGYPVYSTSGLQLSTVFNPLITPGAALNITTEFDFVNRTLWVAAVLSHMIEPNMPGGQWTTQLAANSFGAKGNNGGQAAGTSDG